MTELMLSSLLTSLLVVGMGAVIVWWAHVARDPSAVDVFTHHCVCGMQELQDADDIRVSCHRVHTFTKCTEAH